MACDIIIPVWNQLESTKICLEHLVKNPGYPYRLIIIDNASDAATKEYLQDFVRTNTIEARLIRNEENLGYVKAVNQGLKISDSPYVCLMNNDTVPGPGWLSNLVEFAESRTEIGLVNPLSNGHGEKSVDEYARMLEKNRGLFMETNQCFGFCMLIKREVIDKIGVLDERFGMGGFDDTDYSMRAHLAGYRCACVYSSYVYHREHVSFNAMGDRKKLVSKQETEYFKKWPRHLRVGIGFAMDISKDDRGIEDMLKGVLHLAREWCWVNVWLFGRTDENRDRVKSLSKKIGMPLHQNIKFNYLPGAFLAPQLLVRLMERSFGSKRRKKYDLVIVDDMKTGNFLNAFLSLHKTKIDYCDPGSDGAGYTRKILNEQRTTNNGQRKWLAT